MHWLHQHSSGNFLFHEWLYSFCFLDDDCRMENQKMDDTWKVLWRRGFFRIHRAIYWIERVVNMRPYCSRVSSSVTVVVVKILWSASQKAEKWIRHPIHVSFFGHNLHDWDASFGLIWRDWIISSSGDFFSILKVQKNYCTKILIFLK